MGSWAAGFRECRVSGEIGGKLRQTPSACSSRGAQYRWPCKSRRRKRGVLWPRRRLGWRKREIPFSRRQKDKSVACHRRQNIMTASHIDRRMVQIDLKIFAHRAHHARVPAISVDIYCASGKLAHSMIHPYGWRIRESDIPQPVGAGVGAMRGTKAPFSSRPSSPASSQLRTPRHSAATPSVRPLSSAPRVRGYRRGCGVTERMRSFKQEDSLSRMDDPRRRAVA
jgi:hypothetical protein